MSCTDGKKRYNARAFTLEATNTENPMKKMTRIAALITFAGLLCACNTVQGFGQDVEKPGRKCLTLPNAPSKRRRDRVQPLSGNHGG